MRPFTVSQFLDNYTTQTCLCPIKSNKIKCIPRNPKLGHYRRELIKLIISCMNQNFWPESVHICVHLSTVCPQTLKCSPLIPNRGGLISSPLSLAGLWPPTSQLGSNSCTEADGQHTHSRQPGLHWPHTITVNPPGQKCKYRQIVYKHTHTGEQVNNQRITFSVPRCYRGEPVTRQLHSPPQVTLEQNFVYQILNQHS